MDWILFWELLANVVGGVIGLFAITGAIVCMVVFFKTDHFIYDSGEFIGVCLGVLFVGLIVFSISVDGIPGSYVDANRLRTQLKYPSMEELRKEDMQTFNKFAVLNGMVNHTELNKNDDKGKD